jgi:serine/threonine-protein kinase
MSALTCPNCGGSHANDCPGPDLSGRTLAGGILVYEKVGESAQRSIYRAQEIRTGLELELITLKVDRSWTMSPGSTSDVDRVWDQLSRARGIHHPNVASVKGMGMVPEGSRWVALELVRGELLSEILSGGSVLPSEKAVDLVTQAAWGLQAAHDAGVVHGGLSPECLLVTHTRQGRPLVKVIRFGARAEAEYAANERLTGWNGDPRCDVYSLGAVLYRLLTGKPPSGEAASGNAITENLREVVSRALDPLPERRFSTPGSFAAALAAACKEPPMQEVRSGGRVRRLASGIVGLGILTAVAWFLAGREPVLTGPASIPNAGSFIAPESQRAPVPASTDSTVSSRSRTPAPRGHMKASEGAGTGVATARRRHPPTGGEMTPPSGAAPPTTVGAPPTQGDSVMGYAPDRSAAPPAPHVPTATGTGAPASVGTSLTGTPAMRLALGDVMRLGIAVHYREVQPGRLVLTVGDGYRTSTSLEYNLRQLYAAYAELLSYPRPGPVIELWGQGRKIAEYTRNGLRSRR